MRPIYITLLSLCAAFFVCNCDTPKAPEKQQTPKTDIQNRIAMNKLVKDHHSYSKPNESRVTHLSWKAEVNFEAKSISATATFDLQNAADAKEVIFDVNGLTDFKIEVDGKDVSFELGKVNELLGQPLIIPISPETKQVSITYKSAPGAKALLWVDGEKPFLFSQSQAILARTWIPCQDSPGVRYTYDAEVKVRKDLLALMSAENPTEKNETGVYSFKMDQPIPSYLMALAVGDVEYKSIGDRTGVYATPDMIDAAHYEFQEMDEMLVKAEKLYGKYVCLIAHELAHSWSGNLVTNSTWDDFWLNEGFTVYFEMRIMEAVYGRYLEMDLESWIYSKGLPENLPQIQSNNMAKVDALTKSMNATADVSVVPWATWKYQEKVRFLSQLPKDLESDFMTRLDAAFNITNSGNNEVLFEWLEQSIYRNYEAAFPRAEKFLIEIGRRKFLTPLYDAFKKTGRIEIAKSIYAKARPGYHSVAVETMDELLLSE